jgi:hypothetical protein
MTMAYNIKPLACDPTRIKGMSEKLLVSHYENNYRGAVNRLNAITAQLAELDFAKAPGFVLNGLKREELIASNSMILHEVFFASLGDESAPEGELREALTRDFGSLDRWQAEFSAMGKAQGGGSGCAADLVAARRQAHQSVGYGPHDDTRRRVPDPCARHVRALLSLGLRSESGRLCRCVHRGDQLAKCRAGLSRIAFVSFQPPLTSTALRSMVVLAIVGLSSESAGLMRE